MSDSTVCSVIAGAFTLIAIVAIPLSRAFLIVWRETKNRIEIQRQEDKNKMKTARIVRVGTKVFATESERDRVIALIDRVNKTPNRADEVMGYAHRVTHELATSHGLPDTEGQYGMDLQTREFLRATSTP